MKRLLSSCQSQLVTKITNIQAVMQKNTVQNTRPTYIIWRDICLKRLFMGYIYKWATHRNNDRGRQNTQRIFE